MKLLKLYDGDYPWDVRVEKMLRSLAGAGHGVTLVARNRKALPRREVRDGVTLRRLPSFGRAGALLTFPAFANPVWAAAAWRAARECRPERVIVRDLPLAPLGLWIARRLRVPAIVDMAEPYPEALRSNWQFDRLGGLDHVLRSPRAAEAVERWVLRRSPRVLVVSPEAGERLERLGLARERWTLVGNTPDLARLDCGMPPSRPLPDAFAGRPLLIFTGILVGDRGLDVAIAGLAQLGSRSPRPALLVIGDGPARDRYEAQARRRFPLRLARRWVFRAQRSTARCPSRWWVGPEPPACHAPRMPGSMRNPSTSGNGLRGRPEPVRGSRSIPRMFVA